MRKELIPLLLLALIFTSGTAYARSAYVSPDYNWFTVTPEFTNSGLPTGVSITQGDYQTGHWTIENKSATPLYLLTTFREHDESVPVEKFPETPLPDGLYPKNKLVSGQVYIIGIVGKQTYPFDEVEKYVSEKCGADNCVYSDRVVIDSLTSQMKVTPKGQVYENNRPTELTIPKPEDFTVLAYYGTQPSAIKGRFIYSLNEHYGEGGYIPAESKTYSNLFWGGVMIFVICLGYVILRKVRNTTSQK